MAKCGNRTRCGMSQGLYNPFFQNGAPWYGSGGEAPYELPPEYEDLISYWTLDNDFALDFANIYGNHGQDEGNPQTTTGKIGNAWQFNGTSQYITIKDANSLSFNSGGGVDLPFTFSFWVNPSSLAVQRPIFAKRNSDLSLNEYQIQLETSGAVRINLYQNNNQSVFLRATSNGTISTSVWSHVCITYDGSKVIGGIKIYINGVLQTITNGSSGSYTTGMASGASNLEIGRIANNALFFAGLLDEISIFSVALDQSRIDAIYNGGAGLAFDYDPDQDLHIYKSSYNVLATRGSYQLATDGTDLYWSDDNGQTYINQYAWGTQFSTIPVYNKYIEFAYIFSDGIAIWACGPLVFRTTNKLQSVSSVTLYLSDGVTPYPIHTPANSTRPGSYVQSLGIDPNHNDDDMLVWVNYCNVNYNGAAPVTVWYTTDKGATIKAAYRFGQNSSWRDNGTASGGGGSGTFLGDSGNSIICRHGHHICRHPGTNDWYLVTGDASGGEVHWFRGTYTPGTDSWSFTQIITSANENTRYKCGTMQIIGDTVYWAADCTGTVPLVERGVFQASLSDIQGTSTRIFDTTEIEAIYLNINPDTNMAMVLMGGASTHGGSLWVLENLGAGRNWRFRVDNAVTGESGGKRLGKVYPPDSRGYMKMNFGRVNEEVLGTVYIKM